ncbi:MAG: hypothetical protein LBD85_03550 [Oscillospiraceae bacterium]|nr:hypothetical protein [Oscillospiraceae bacterium]
MKRQRKGKSILSILTLALAAVLFMSFAAPAFAEGESETDPNLITATGESSPAMAAIRKVLQMPEGTTTPATTFTFTFAKVNVDGYTSGSDEFDAMPTIGNKSVTYANGDAGTTTNGVKMVAQEVNVLSGDELDTDFFPHAGVYVYEIAETPDTFSDSDATDNYNETMTYSQGEYTITFYVKDKANVPGTYVYAIGVKIATKDNNGQGETNTKVDPTPDDEEGGGGSAMVFTNTYLKTPNTNIDPTTPTNWVLNISKAVSGDYADRTKYFTYTLTVTNSSDLITTNAYKAYVLNATTNAVVTSTDNADNVQEDNGNRNYIAVAASSPATIKLKHDQRIVFVDLPTGTKYVAVETGATDYTASVDMKVNGDTPFTRSNTQANTALSTGSDASTAGDVLIGEGANSAAFTNTYKDVTPTGVLINNLPFILILLVALGGFVLFIVVKSRKRRKENHNQN